MNYTEFLENKKVRLQDSGFEVETLNKYLFDFQEYIVRLALKKGRYAIFAECGLGKTLMQLEWSYQIVKRFNQSVLIFTPLAVSEQTIEEGVKFEIDVKHYKDYKEHGIYISNYEQIDNIDFDNFIGIVLDESSILKNYTGVYKNKLIDFTSNIPYKLCCTATPSPNDINEIGNHAEFLSIMRANEMRARWFVRDEGMNNYRLKRYAHKEFYGWINQWSCFISNPADIGFDGSKFILPELKINEIEIQSDVIPEETLFNENAVNATSFNQQLRLTKSKRMNKVAEIVNNSNENFIIWVKMNEEAQLVKSLIPHSVEVHGSETTEAKEKKLLDFAKNKFRVLITKPKIAQFGMNFQNCNNQIFASLDFSFESLYQSIRRSYRFGQEKEVNITLITTDTMQNVINSIKQKERLFMELRDNVNNTINEKQYYLLDDYNFRKEVIGDSILYNGDSCEVIDEIPDNSIDFSIFSPPFSNLFIYSDSIRDMGNSKDNDEFFQNYKFLIQKLYSKIRPGRLIAIHTKDMPIYKTSSGYTGLYNFTGEHHKIIEECGFKYHSKITIWTDPVLEMQRTKTQRLLYKQVTSDSTKSGIGLAEYVTIFRKIADDDDLHIPVTSLNKTNFPLDTWQKWASPVWMDILRTDVLDNREGVDINDEKHICPLQLGVISRLIIMYSNEGETVFSPFAGIGSEIYQAIKLNRKGIGIELKESYFNQAVRNCKLAEQEINLPTLFAS